MADKVEKHELDADMLASLIKRLHVERHRLTSTEEEFEGEADGKKELS